MSKIFKKVGKGLKNIGKFIAKEWRTIAIVALSVYTMGLATVGFSGFSGAMAGAGGGFGGFMSAVGSTMWAGVTAAGGTLGIGPGAQGAAAVAGGVEGVGLFGGHLAAALGSESAKAGIAAQTAPGAGVTLTGIGPAAEATTTPLMGGAPVGSVPSAGSTITAPLTSVPAPSGGLSGLGQAALITVGGNMASGYFAGKAAEEDDPRGFWGVDLTGEGGDAPPPGLNRQPPPNLFAAEAPPPAQALPQVRAPMPPVPGLMNQPWQAPGVIG